MAVCRKHSAGKRELLPRCPLRHHKMLLHPLRGLLVIFGLIPDNHVHDEILRSAGDDFSTNDTLCHGLLLLRSTEGPTSGTFTTTAYGGSSMALLGEHA